MTAPASPIPAPPTEGTILCRDVSFRYPTATGQSAGVTTSDASGLALEHVNLEVAAGERLGILGPNGGGKSTLLKLILGLLSGHTGTIRVCGVSPSAARAAGLIGYVAQRPNLELAMPISVREYVELAAGWREPPWRGISSSTQGRARDALDHVGAAALADRPIGKLSGGQLQRVLIARALVTQPRVLVLDEPAVGIDAAGQQMLAELLDRVHRETRATILIVSHDLRAIAAGSDRVACLARRLHYHASPAGLTPAVLGELFSHDVLGAIAGPRGAALGEVHVHAHAAADCPLPSAPPPLAAVQPHAHACGSCGSDHGTTTHPGDLGTPRTPPEHTGHGPA